MKNLWDSGQNMMRNTSLNKIYFLAGCDIEFADILLSTLLP